MSTTPTNEPRRQRRGRLNPPPFRRGDRRSGTVRTGTTPAPGTTTPPGGSVVVADRAGQDVVNTARERGARAARRGVFDPWVLQSKDRIPYFAELASERDRVIGRIGEQARLAEEQERLNDVQAGVEVTRCETDTAVVRERLREVDRQIVTAKEQLDLLARRTTRWNRFRDGIRARLEARWMEETFPATPARGRPGADDEGRAEPVPAGIPAQARSGGADDEDEVTGLQTVPRTGEAPRPDDGPTTTPDPGVRADLRTGHRPPPTADAWEGLTKRPGLPAWMTWATLLALVLVEAPIYWAAFQPFHGVGTVDADTQTITLAAAAAVVMVLLPHLAGRMLRWRATTGSVRVSWLPALTLLGVWVGLTVLFGVLRAKFVTQSEEADPAPAEGAEGFAGVDTEPAGTLLDRLDLAPQTVTAMFCALLLLSGGIGFLLGLFREHPFLDAYRTAVENRAGLVRRLEESIAATERARGAQETADARREDRRQATEERLDSVHALYNAAAAAYLDSLAAQAGDPAVTEAAMKLSNTWPLLPVSRARR
ncbi:hypothetical protein [Streptomyces rochei]|uniref:hypothetical protein n=1 Tax=Streptomyces rochei TaxID=1928 RepID=UPI00378DC91B